MFTLPATLSNYVGSSQPIAALLRGPAYQQLPVKSVELGFPTATNSSTLAIAANTSSPLTLSVPAGTQRVDAVYYGNQAYTPATDPNLSNLQPGQFIYNSLTNQIIVSPVTTFKAGYNLVIQTANPEAVMVEYALTSATGLPDIFTQYEVKGAIAWSCDWEGHPQGAFELLCSWAVADTMETILIPRQTVLEIFGIGFEVATLKISKRSPLECPNLEATVFVTLRGKWERLLDEQVALQMADYSGTQPVGARTIWGDTTVGAIAAKVGAVAIAPSNTVEAPKQVGQQTLVTLKEPLEGVMRPNGCFARYSNANYIEAVGIDDVSTYNVSYNDLYNQKLDFQINASPVALDYRNCPLQWGDKTTATDSSGEDTQGKYAQKLPPLWRQKPPNLEVKLTGSATLSAPSNIVDLIDPSFVFDNGGPTRAQTQTWTENGAIIRQEYAKNGFKAVAYLDLYTQGTATDPVSGDTTTVWLPRDPSIIAGLWATIEYWTAEYTYENDSGYLREIRIRGYRWLRLKSEQQNDSLQAYTDWDEEDQTTPDADNPNGLDPKTAKLLKLKAYEYSQVPVQEETIYFTQYLRSHYGDIPPQPTEDYTYTVPIIINGVVNPFLLTAGPNALVAPTTLNGQPAVTITAKIPVPGWTDPQYCEYEASRKWCFLSQPDPDSTQEKPLPDMTSGEDKTSEMRVYVGDYRNRPKTLQPGTWIEAESYIEYQHLHVQREAGFKRSAREVSDDLRQGRPQEHTRKEQLFEKIDPSLGEKPPDEYEYIVSTASYADTRIKGSTLNYPYARSLAEALKAVATDYRIINSRDTKTTEAVLKYSNGIREGDIINLEGHGPWQVRSYSKSMAILAPGVLQPSRMTLQLGKAIPAPTTNLEKRPIPKPDAGNGTGTSTSSAGYNYGDLLSGRSRGNSQGV